MHRNPPLDRPVQPSGLTPFEISPDFGSELGNTKKIESGGEKNTSFFFFLLKTSRRLSSFERGVFFLMFFLLFFLYEQIFGRERDPTNLTIKIFSPRRFHLQYSQNKFFFFFTSFLSLFYTSLFDHFSFFAKVIKAIRIFKKK